MFSSNIIIKETGVFQYFKIEYQSMFILSVKIIKTREKQLFFTGDLIIIFLLLRCKK